jgi:hypothetical protein
MSILPLIQMRRKHGLAIADYGKAIELDPKNVPAYKKAGELAGKSKP